MQMRELRLRVIVTPGSVTVHHVDILHADENCCVLEIGTREKQPEIWGVNSSPAVWLRAPGAPEDTPGTQVQIEGFTPDKANPWLLLTDLDRYAVQLVMYRDQRVLAAPQDRDRWRIWEPGQEAGGT